MVYDDTVFCAINDLLGFREWIPLFVRSHEIAVIRLNQSIDMPSFFDLLHVFSGVVCTVKDQDRSLQCVLYNGIKALHIRNVAQIRVAGKWNAIIVRYNIV